MEYILLERIEQDSPKNRYALLEKITAYPNQAIHDDYAVAFIGGYEKIDNENQSQRVNVDKWYST